MSTLGRNCYNVGMCNGVDVIRSAFKLGLCGLVGAAHMGCSNGTVHGGDVEKSSDTIDKRPVFETSFGRFTIKPNVVRPINAKTSPFWNYDLKRNLTWEEIKQAKLVHYYAGIGSDIPYQKSGFYSYEFGHLNIFTPKYKSTHDVLYSSDKGIVDLTDTLNKTAHDWGAELYPHTNRGPEQIDMPYVKETLLTKYQSPFSDLSPVVGYCLVSLDETNTRCRFTGLYKEKIPFRLVFDAPTSPHVKMGKNNSTKFLLGRFPALETEVENVHARLKVFFESPL